MSSFFCANNYYTSLLLIVCALSWYEKSLYRHFFLEDIAKHARVTQKMAPPPPHEKSTNCQAPWATNTKLPEWIANTLSCDMTQPYLKRGEVLNRYETLYFKPRQSSRKICDPASSNNHISTFLHAKFFFDSVISQLRLVGSHNRCLGSLAQGVGPLEDFQIRKCNFLSDPWVFGYIF